uniref:Prolylcarboxypeptidase n=2 Tax=Rhizochromulina marina TaxID=1034831 RepID=A0A7S2STF0_9STRA
MWAMVCLRGLLVAGLAGLLPAASAASDPSAANASYRTLFFNQTLDHFAPPSAAAPRWQHRYLLNDEYWDGRGELQNGCKGPILLYTGNEGDITGFWSSNGFMVNVLAPKWGGLLVFPEERYYGESLPFGEASFTAENLVYLTTEQVLEDYVELVASLKKSLGAENCPVVAFGGSYGGTLTTLLRTAYPATVVGGLAASAPVGYYDVEGWESHGVDTYTWSDIVTRDYAEADPSCMDAIHAASAAVNEAPTDEVVEAFHVCDAAALGPSSQSDLFAYALESLPQLDYPYAVGGLPAWPVNASCSVLVQAYASGASSSLVFAAASITKLALDIDDSGACLEAMEGPGGIPGDGPGPGNWGYQSCTETLHEFSTREDGVRNYTFDYVASGVHPCNALFNSTVTPDTAALTRRFGGYKIGDGEAGVTNMIWSNGRLDPWSGGGFLTPVPDATSNHWVLLDKGAHHLDLRGPHPDDPEEVTNARALEEEIIWGWIEAASRS